MSTASSVQSSVADGDGSGEFMLFGVRVNVDPMRKCVSLNNLSQYEVPLPQEFLNVRTEASGYVSADDVVHRLSLPVSRDRKRGVPWTEDEHKLFLLGLQKAGKGDWRGISKNFVKTRTPTQVASHAQKYFLRQTNLNRRRRRTSLFDITTDSVTPTPMEEKDQEEHKAQPVLPPAQPSRPGNSFLSGAQVFHFPLPGKIGSQVEISASAPVIPVVPKPARTRMLDLNLNQEPSEDLSPWSLDLSLSLDQGQGQKHFSTNSAFEVMPSFSHGDSMISVA